MELCANLASALPGCVSEYPSPTGQDPQMLRALLLTLFSSLTPPLLFMFPSSPSPPFPPHSSATHTWDTPHPD